MNGPLHERHFTLDEAKKALAEVRPLVEEMSTLKEALDRQGFNLSPSPVQMGPGLSTNGHKPYPKEFIRLTDMLRRFAETGVQIKDVGAGLIDFPHLRDSGEEVYLCWKLGEQTLGFWHRIQDGFAGRRPIETL